MAGKFRPDAIKAARLHQQALANAVARQPEVFDKIDRGVLGRMADHPRLKSRLIRRITDTGITPPSDLSGSARWLASAGAAELQTVILFAGLTYRIASIGPVLDQTITAALKQALGLDAVKFALRHTTLSPAGVAPLPLETARAEVEADGARILHLWASGNGAATIWLPQFEPDATCGSLLIHRDAARLIAETVIAWVCNPEGGQA